MRAVLLAWPGRLGYTDLECVCEAARDSWQAAQPNDQGITDIQRGTGSIGNAKEVYGRA
jgi:hypothetical protein